MNYTAIDDNAYNIAAFVAADSVAVGDLVYADGKFHPVTHKTEIGPRRVLGSQIILTFAAGGSLWLAADAIVAVI